MSISDMKNPPSPSPERDEILEQYIRLSQESSRLRNQILLSGAQCYSASEAVSPGSSPNHKSPLRSAHTSTWGESPTPTVPSSEAQCSGTSLFEVGQQIKATLTSLLNCDSVKHDPEFRAWVQERLMDAEHELKQARRRRSSLDREEAMKKLWDFGGRTENPEWRSAF